MCLSFHVCACHGEVWFLFSQVIKQWGWGTEDGDFSEGSKKINITEKDFAIFKNYITENWSKNLCYITSKMIRSEFSVIFYTCVEGRTKSSELKFGEGEFHEKC